MMATSEPQTPAPQLDFLELASLLRRKVDGESFPHSFIHEADPYSAPPEVLVRRREHAPGTDQGDGKGIAWYFCSPAKYHESGVGGSARRRCRQVGGVTAAAEKTCWHSETGKQKILGPDRKSTGAYRDTLSYVLKIKNPPAAPKPYRNKSLGWIMVEIGLEHQQAGQQLVLCKVYRSPHTDPETPTAARPARVEDVGQAAVNGVPEGGVILDESVNVPGGNTPAPPPASCANNLCSQGVVLNPALSIVPAPKYGTCWPGGRIPSRVAIVKKADVTAAGAVTVVMKFGRSSMPSVERMKEMAKLVFSFPPGAGQIVAVVLSEMGNTTNNVLMAAWKALTCGDQKASEIHEFAIIKGLYLRAIDELGLDRSTVSGSLEKLEHHLQHIAMTKELPPSTREFLVSFGDRTSTEMFSEYLKKLGQETLQEWELRAFSSFGRGGSDLTAAIIGKDLGTREIQVWKDVDGIFTCDPKVCATAILVPFLTFDEAAELSYFSEQSMQVAKEAGISVIVKNSYNPQAPGTVITKTRDMSTSTLTIIVLKSNITMMDIERKSMLSQNAFVAKAFSIFHEFEDLVISPNYADEGKMSLTLVPSKLLSQELIQLELDSVVEKLKTIAAVDVVQHRSVISLIGSTQIAIFNFQKAVNVLRSIDVEVQVSQWLSKQLVTKISLVVDDSEAELCVQALHSAFFDQTDAPPPVGVNLSAAASSSGSGIQNRKAVAGDDQPEAPLGLLHESAYSTDQSASVVARSTFLGHVSIMPAGRDNHVAPNGVDDLAISVDDYLPNGLCLDDLDLSFLHEIEAEDEQGLAEAAVGGGAVEENMESDLEKITRQMLSSDDDDTIPATGRGDYDSKPRPSKQRKCKSGLPICCCCCFLCFYCCCSSKKCLQRVFGSIRSLAAGCWAACRKRDGSFKNEV